MQLPGALPDARCVTRQAMKTASAMLLVIGSLSRSFRANKRESELDIAFEGSITSDDPGQVSIPPGGEIRNETRC
jgi:hypothetical protein